MPTVSAVRTPTPGQPEDHLDVQGEAAERVREVEPPDVHRRDQAVPQDVPADHPLLRQPLRPRGPHPVLVDRPEERRPHDLHVRARERQPGRYPGQDQVARPLERVVRSFTYPPSGNQPHLWATKVHRSAASTIEGTEYTAVAAGHDRPVRPAPPVANAHRAPARRPARSTAEPQPNDERDRHRAAPRRTRSAGSRSRRSTRRRRSGCSASGARTEPGSGSSSPYFSSACWRVKSLPCSAPPRK